MNYLCRFRINIKADGIDVDCYWAKNGLFALSSAKELSLMRTRKASSSYSPNTGLLNENVTERVLPLTEISLGKRIPVTGSFTSDPPRSLKASLCPEFKNAPPRIAMFLADTRTGA